jgi:MFS transporter, putative metabolite:H+ symporter
MEEASKRQAYLMVLIAALGYFVDAYDLILFIVIRNASVTDLGATDLTATGLALFNTQMLGTLLGGIGFGMLGDKKGRLSVLFASILLYSLANLANAFVVNISQYHICRFIAGLGLAGELGVGITLVSEILPKNKRGYGTAVVAASGAAGAVAAGVFGGLTQWRTAYIIGACLGLTLLFLRIGSMDSALFNKAKTEGISRGNFLKLFTNFSRFKRFMGIIFMSLPVFFTITILMQLSPELSKVLQNTGFKSAGWAVSWVYVGLSIGDISSGLLAQYLKSRLGVIRFFIVLSALFLSIHLNVENLSSGALAFSYILLGFSAGFWVSLLTLAAESFGTNLRATVATTVPNVARAAAIPISATYTYLLDSNSSSAPSVALYIGLACSALALGASFLLDESFTKDLDYLEH